MVFSAVLSNLAALPPCIVMGIVIVTSCMAYAAPRDPNILGQTVCILCREPA
jgi:hypothetical protein